jgi:small-conductance mechanosensitive channel
MTSLGFGFHLKFGFRKASMSETIKTITHWLTTSGIKIVGILIGLIILSQMSRWIVKWMEKFLSEKDPLQATEAKKRAHTVGNILRHGLLIVISFIAIMMILGELGIQLGPLLATAGIGALAIGFGAQSLVKDVIKGSKIGLMKKGFKPPSLTESCPGENPQKILKNENCKLVIGHLSLSLNGVPYE